MLFHCMGHGRKQATHTILKNAVFALALQAGTRPSLEPVNLFSINSRIRPTDILVMGAPHILQSSWRRFPRLALDVAVTSPFQSRILGVTAQETLAVARQYGEHKRTHDDLRSRCVAQNIGCEPLVWESTGGLDAEGKRLLRSLVRMVDEKRTLCLGTTWAQFKIRVSFEL